MNTYYVTLTRELFGYCIEAKAPSELVLREYLRKHYGSLWCSIYGTKPEEEIIGSILIVFGVEDH